MNQSNLSFVKRQSTRHLYLDKESRDWLNLALIKILKFLLAYSGTFLKWNNFISRKGATKGRPKNIYLQTWDIISIFLIFLIIFARALMLSNFSASMLSGWSLNTWKVVRLAQNNNKIGTSSVWWHRLLCPLFLCTIK